MIHTIDVVCQTCNYTMGRMACGRELVVPPLACSWLYVFTYLRNYVLQYIPLFDPHSIVRVSCKIASVVINILPPCATL